MQITSKYVAVSLCLSLACSLTASMGLLTPAIGTAVTLLWLPTGIAAPVLLPSGLRQHEIMNAWLCWRAGDSMGVIAAAPLVLVRNRAGFHSIRIHSARSVVPVRSSRFFCSGSVMATAATIGWSVAGLRRAQVRVNVVHTSLDLERAVPPGLITNDLVSNALKYAFPDGRTGSIRVDFAVDSHNTYELTIADDGMGLLESFDLNQRKSLGLQRTRDLIQQLSGSLKIVYAPGTEFRISFPLLPSNDGGLL